MPDHGLRYHYLLKATKSGDRNEQDKPVVSCSVKKSKKTLAMSKYTGIPLEGYQVV